MIGVSALLGMMGSVAFGATELPFVTHEVFGTARHVQGAGNDAMALDMEGKYLYAGEAGKIVVYDVSEPLAPKKLGEVDGLGAVRQLVVQERMVYASARESGMWIVDATNPAKPRIRSRFDCCELATGIDVAGKVVFLGQRQNGVEFIDVSDPDRPAHIAMRKTDESQSVIYRDGYAYSGDWGTGHLTVFDARDMRNIRQIAYVPLWGFGDGVWKRGKYLYAATGHHSKNRDLSTLKFKPVDTPDIRNFGKFNAGSGCGHGLDIFDVEDPSNPKRVGRVDYPPFYARGLDMWTPRTSASSETVFAVQTHNGLFAVDCTDKTNPKVLDRWVFPSAKHPEHPSCCLASVVVGKGCVYVAGKGCGVVVIPAKGAAPEKVAKGIPPSNPDFREPYPTDTESFHVWKSERPGQARTVALKGDVAYVACGDAGLHVLKILSQGGFKKIGELQGRDRVFDVAIEGNKMYTAEGLDGFAAYEIAGETEFKEIGRRKWLNDRHDPALWVWKPTPGWLVLSTRRSGVELFHDDAWEKGHSLARAAGCPGWDKYLMDAPIGKGRWLGYNMANTALSWLDLTAKKGEMLKKGSPKSRISLSNGMCRFDDTRALVTKNDGYFFLEGGVIEPEGKEWKVKKFPGQGFSGIPRVSEGKLVVVTGRIVRKVGLWDFSDAEQPKHIKTWQVSGNPDLAVFYGEKFIVPCGHQGVIMLR